MNQVLKKLTSYILPLLSHGLKTKWYAFLKSKNQAPTPYNAQVAQRLQDITVINDPSPSSIASAADDTFSDIDETPETNYQRCNLIMVTIDNNNKFYNMEEKGDGTFVVTYGRVGNTGLTETYSMEKWQTKYKEKIKKGYVDNSALFLEKSIVDVSLENIPSELVRELMKSLQTYANTSISKHYNVSSAQVSLAQVTEAQRLLDSLVMQTNDKVDLALFNKELLQLYTIIPRKMRNVQANLIAEASTNEDILKVQILMANEQATLDVMRSQVELQQMKNNNSGQAKLNILEILGLEITEIQSRETIHLIKKLMDNESNRFVSAYKVINKRTQKLFDAMLTFQANKATHLFWHGSRNENWLSILETGLVLRPANAAISGKMFGYGLYFADRFRKSLNYTSINGSFWARGSSNRAYLSLFAVHTGNPYIIENRESWHGNMTSTMLQTKGDFDSVSALKGFDLINNEYIVYRENQCTIQYLVEIKTA